MWCYKFIICAEKCAHYANTEKGHVPQPGVSEMPIREDDRYAQS